MHLLERVSGKLKYTKEVLEEAVKNSESFVGVVRFLGLKVAGGTQTHIANTIKKMDIDTSHFLGKGHNKGKISFRRKSYEQILIKREAGRLREKPYLLRRALLESGVEHKCNGCGLPPVWQGVPLVLEVNHIDGDFLNCLKENLEFLCPNCHSQEKNSNLPHKFRERSL